MTNEVEATLVPETEVDIEPQIEKHETEVKGVEEENAPWYSDLNLDLSEYDGNTQKELQTKLYNVLKKFKSPTDLVKSYADLESSYTKFSMKGAPEEYKLPNPDEYNGFEFDDNNPALRELKEFGKESGLTQEAFNNILDIWHRHETEKVPNREEEFKKLGPDAELEVDILSQWIDNNFDPEEAQMMKNFATTAENVRLLQKVRNLSMKGEKTVPEDKNEVAQFVGKNPTVEDIVYSDIEMNYDRYINDEVYRKMVQEKLYRAQQNS